MKLSTSMKLVSAVALAFAAHAAVADSQHRTMINTMTPFNGLARSLGPGPPDLTQPIGENGSILGGYDLVARKASGTRCCELAPEPREGNNELLARKAGSKGGDLVPEAPREGSYELLARKAGDKGGGELAPEPREPVHLAAGKADLINGRR